MIKSICFDVGGTLVDVNEKPKNLSDYNIFEDVVPALNQLSGYRLAILSNSTPEKMTSIQDLGLALYFDVIVHSCDIGLAKPDMEAYRIVENKLGLKPENLVMVGDSKIDIYGAKKAGWHAIYLDRKHDTDWGSGPFEPDSVIRSLSDLSNTINSLLPRG